MFRGKYERQQEVLGQELGPYLNMASDLEVEQRLQVFEQDLELSGRTVLTSNDRYQTSECYLSLSRNRHQLMAGISERIMTDDGARELSDAPEASQQITHFLVGGFQEVRDTLELVDALDGQPGYRLTASDTEQIRRLTRTQWLPEQATTWQMAFGVVEAMDKISAYVAAQFRDNVDGKSVPNDFRLAIRQKVAPLLAIVEAKKKAIDRVSNGSLETVTSGSLVSGMYEDARQAIDTLNEITVWATIPKLYDHRFELKRPLDEANPNRRAFDPAAIARPVVQRQIAPAKPAGKPFSPDALGQASAPAPAPHAPVPPHPQGKPFSADILSRAVPSGGRPAHRPAGKQFDPSVLGMTKPSGAPAETPHPAGKSFESDELNPKSSGPASDK